MKSLKGLSERSWNLSSTQRALFSFLCIATIFVMNILLQIFFPGYSPMSLFLTAIVVTAWAAGTTAGLLATFLGALAEIFLLGSPTRFFPLQEMEGVRLIVYLIQGFMISGIFGEFHAGQLRIATSERRLSAVLRREKKIRALTEQALRELRHTQVQIEKEREAAQNASRIKTLFLAHMSHEIRTPLGAILGFTDLLKDPALSDTDRKDYISIIERTGNHLSDIINDILDISKVEAGRLEIECVPFSLKNLIGEVHSVLAMKCAEKNLDLRIRQDGPVPDTIVTDPSRLRQILVNLVGNAVKFTERGFIEIHYFMNGDQLVFNFIDTGIGITPEQERKLFENFSQGDDSISRRFAGTGLGLALSRKLAHMMGGDLSLISSRPHEGSVFELRLNDVTAKAYCPRINSSRGDDGVISFAGKKVLVVDDAPDNRFLLERVLGKMNFEVITAEHGIMALELAGKQTFDLIFMDMQMPVMDGYTTVRKLKESRCETPVIALTAHALKEDREKCIRAGCRDYLTKPLHKEQLVEILKTYCHTA